jgi:hypothetical protein
VIAPTIGELKLLFSLYALLFAQQRQSRADPVALVAAADRDPVVRARLDACVFKGAVKNRKSGEWEAVPMCAMSGFTKDFRSKRFI